MKRRTVTVDDRPDKLLLMTTTAMDPASSCTKSFGTKRKLSAGVGPTGAGAGFGRRRG